MVLTVPGKPTIDTTSVQVDHDHKQDTLTLIIKLALNHQWCKPKLEKITTKYTFIFNKNVVCKKVVLGCSKS